MIEHPKVKKSAYPSNAPSGQDRRWKFWMEAYYGPNAKHPKIEGELAIGTVHTDESSCKIEIEAAANRKDIGQVVWGEFHG